MRCLSLCRLTFIPIPRIPTPPIQLSISPYFATKPSSCHVPAHTHTHHSLSPCCDNRRYSLFFPSFTLSPPHLKYAGRRLTRCLSHSPPLSLSLLHSRGSPRLSSRWKTGRRREEGRRRRWWRERVQERRGGHGNGGMRRERFLSLPLFFVAVTGPQKQERVVHLQVAAVSSFIGWLWM